MSTRWNVRVHASLAIAGIAMLTGCAPRVTPPPALDHNEVRVRFERTIDRRTPAASRVESEALMWFSAGGDGSLPGVQARIQLATPDSFRVRVSSSFGIALDVVTYGDSLIAFVPALRRVAALDARVDSLSMSMPGMLACRVWSAQWRPPVAAWSGATRQDSLWVLGWRDEAGEWELEVGASGRPRAAALVLGDGRRWQARYPQWSGGWPAQIEIEAPGGMRMTVKVVRTVALAGRDAFRMRVPAGARAIDRREMGEWMGRLIDMAGAR